MGVFPKEYREMRVDYVKKLTFFSFIKELVGLVYLIFLFVILPAIIVLTVGYWLFF